MCGYHGDASSLEVDGSNRGNASVDAPGNARDRGVFNHLQDHDKEKRDSAGFAAADLPPFNPVLSAA